MAAAPTRNGGKDDSTIRFGLVGSRPQNKTESGTAAAPARDGGKDGSTIRLG